MLMAAFAGGAAGIGVLVRLYWHRILGVFSKKHQRSRRGDLRRPDGQVPDRHLTQVTAPPDPGSFRDPLSRVYVDGDAVWRGLSDAGLADFEAYAATQAYRDAQADGRLVATTAVPVADAPIEDTLGGRPAPRAPPGADLPVRVDLLDAAGRRPPAARPQPVGPRRGRADQGRHVVQRPVRRLAAGVHRPRVVRATGARRAVGGLPPVLRAVPQPPLPAGDRRHPVPALAPGLAERDLPHPCGPRPRADGSASGATCSPTCASTPAPSPATPTPTPAPATTSGAS